jgi:hypothetical protein
MMLADWAHAAFEAARRRDRDGVIAVLKEIRSYGADAEGDAAMMWMTRASAVIRVCACDLSELKIKPEPDAAPIGEPDLAASRRPPKSAWWVARLFTAYMVNDSQQWATVWESLPEDESERIDWLRMLVGTMALTALAYAEGDVSEDPTTGDGGRCCDHDMGISQRVPPMKLGDSIAVAHMN